MTLLQVERIKLFSTRSPIWCLAGTLAASLLLALPASLSDGGDRAFPFFFLIGVGVGKSIFMILAALAMTTEYRFSTIRVTFLAAPHRISVLAAKTVVLAVVGAITGLICSLAAFFLAKTLVKNPPLPLELTGDMWRQVAGYAPLFAICAVIAVAVGTMIRQSAGAISILLVWSLLLEGLVQLIPNVGEKIQPWLPFQAGAAFVNPDYSSFAGIQFDIASNGPSHLGGLLLFAGYAAVLWLLAALLLTRRDA